MGRGGEYVGASGVGGFDMGFMRHLESIETQSRYWRTFCGSLDLYMPSHMTQLSPNAYPNAIYAQDHHNAI